MDSPHRRRCLISLNIRPKTANLSSRNSIASRQKSTQCFQMMTWIMTSALNWYLMSQRTAACQISQRIQSRTVRNHFAGESQAGSQVGKQVPGESQQVSFRNMDWSVRHFEECPALLLKLWQIRVTLSLISRMAYMNS